MRIVAVAMGIVALVVFSIFLLLAAPLSERPWTTPALTGMLEEHPPPTGVLYHISRAAVHHLWLYLLLLVTLCVLMVVGVIKNKIGSVGVWSFVAFAVLLNVVAIISIKTVAETIPQF
jgi:hypothetical protein